jgi:anti-sigma regulatory factor (Ser/Thr protein kinase)
MDGVTVVRPVGRLDLSSYAPLRDSLLKMLAEQPAGLIVELDELEVDVSTSLTVFATVWMRASRWPNVPFSLIVPGGRIRWLLQRSGITRFAPMHGTLNEALASLGAAPARRRVQLELPHELGSPRRARRFADDICRSWQVPPDLAVEIVLVASELVENALLFTSSDCVLRMELREGLLSVAVRDSSPWPPVLNTPLPDQHDGRGLVLVERTAAAWGWMPASGGKVVWATFALPGRGRRRDLNGEEHE